MRSKIISSSLAILSTALFASNATAQDRYQGPYANIGISQLSADLDLSDLNLQGNSVDLGEETAKIIMINGRLGYRLNQYIAIEGDAGFGIGGDDFQRSIPVDVDPLGVVNIDADADLDVKNYFGSATSLISLFAAAMAQQRPKPLPSRPRLLCPAFPQMCPIPKAQMISPMV